MAVLAAAPCWRSGLVSGVIRLPVGRRLRELFWLSAAPEACGGSPAGVAHGPAMVPFRSPARGCVWIDKTEVTQAQYGEFLLANQRATAQAPYCDWNADFAPSQTCLSDQNVTTNQDGASPVVCVDQCDAEAFCAWAGKRLCAGTWGGAALNDPRQSEWYDACSDGGAHDYPYARNYQPDACNDADRNPTGCATGSCSTVNTGSLTLCAAQSGAFDLTGNVAEWVAECGSISGSTDSCHVRGGGIDTPSGAAVCNVAGDRPRAFASKTLGVRCCAG